MEDKTQTEQPALVEEVQVHRKQEKDDPEVLSECSRSSRWLK